MSQIVQTGDFNCSTGGAVGKGKIYINIPLTVDCPIGSRLYEKFDLNDVHGSHGDIDPMSFSGLTSEGSVVNGYKTYNPQTEGVELTQSLTITKGGDNSFIRRYETLADDLGGVGGDILRNIIIEWENVVDGITPTLKKTRYYYAAIDSGSIPNTDSKSDSSEYSIEVKFQGRPMVIYDLESMGVLDTKLELTVSDTLAYDEVTKMVSGIITIDELMGNEATATISLIDPLDRAPYISLGSGITVTSNTGEFEINTLAPIQDDSEEVQISVIISGIIITQKTLPVTTPVRMVAKVNDIKETAAKGGLTLNDVNNVLKNKSLTYKVKERISGKIVDSGSSKNLKDFEISNLLPNKDYVLGIYYNNREMATHNFRTPKDTEAPKITTFSDKIEVKIGEEVTKEKHIINNGLKVIDNVDGDITETTYVTVNNIDTSKKGTFYQIIRAVDKSGNEATKEIEIIVK